jgi:hypothetical protein
MARLTDDQWSALRQRWEASPRGGFEWLRAWLAAVTGGACGITREGLRLRAAREGWAKHGGGLPGTAPRDAVDGLACPAVPGVGAGAFDCAFDAADLDPGDDGPLREAVLLQHRRDWLQLRKLVSAAVADGGTDAVRRAKLAAELLRAVQDAEARVLGLDADRTDYDSMSDEDLERIVRGRRAR